MIVSVTTLGSATGNAAGAAADVVKYLEGRAPADAGRDPGPTPDLPAADHTNGVVGYAIPGRRPTCPQPTTPTVSSATTPIRWPHLASGWAAG